MAIIETECRGFSETDTRVNNEQRGDRETKGFISGSKETADES